MVDELYYEKNQLLMDEQGVIWILIDIIESKSLLSKKTKPNLSAFVKKQNQEGKARIIKMSFRKFSEQFSPFLHKDKNMVAQILSLEALLAEEAIRPPLPGDQ